VELDRVGVLVLVHHDVVPAPPYVSPHLVVLLEQTHRQEEQIVEVDGAAGAQHLFVACVGVGREHVVVVCAGAGRGGLGDLACRGDRLDASRLPVRDATHDAFQVEAVVVDVDLLGRAAQGPELVAAAVDGEPLRQPELLGVEAENTRAE
jgi:hypothetical protein